MGVHRIVSHSDEPFKSRREAARLLSKELAGRGGRGTVVVGVPRGGVVVADELARLLDAEMDVLLARRLGVPCNSEAVIGSLCEGGQVVIDEEAAAMLAGDTLDVDEQVARQMAAIRKEIAAVRAVHARVSLKGRNVILADDGASTGATMRAAILAARGEGAGSVTVALPVGREDVVEALAREADEVVCLRSPATLGAVGEFYRDYRPVGDAAVLGILDRSNLA